jgi:hypothetical protein
MVVGPDRESPLPDPAARLGKVRSAHPALSWPRRALSPLILAGMTLVIVVVLTVKASAAGGLLAAAFGACACAIYAVPLIRRGTSHVTLHEGGVVSRGRKVDVVSFEDVDEVWFDFEPAGRMAALRSLRLVDTAGVSHLVTLEVEKPILLGNAVLRACSTPLLADARSALSRGEELTFAKIKVTEERILLPRASVKWKDLRLVRMLPGRLAFFRRQAIFPFRNVGLDQIPHPTVFIAIVRDHAPHFELDPLIPFVE